MERCSLRMGMGMPALLAMLLFLMACAYAARDVFTPVAEDAGGRHQFLDDHHKFHELVKLFENEVLSLDGLPTEFCHSCLEISRSAKKILSDPRLFEDVDSLASSICRVVPSELQAKCIRIAEMYKHEAVMFLQDALLEENFCYNSGFCPDKAQETSFPSYRKTELLNPVEPFTKMLSTLQKGLTREAASKFMNSANTFTGNENPLELRSNGTCIACRSVLDKISNELEDPDKQLKIITSLLKACEVEVFVYRCKKLVFSYGPIVISNIQKLVSMDLCHTVQICKDPRNQTSHMNLMSFGNAIAKLDAMEMEDI